MKPQDLVLWLNDNFSEEIIPFIDTVDDLCEAERLMSALTNKYAYLASLTAFAKIAVREEKRKGKENKAAYEDMIDRRDSLDAMASIVLQQYSAISRMLTVKMEINKELNMNMG
jgi:hypothetical protein